MGTKRGWAVARAAVATATLAAGAVAAVTATATPAGATALAPFIDLQEAGLTLVGDGAGLRSLGTGSVDLTVDVGGTVRFAVLYWGGRQSPCDDTPTCSTPEPYRDQAIVFDGTPVTGTKIGTEARPPAGGFPGALEITYFADVTSLVSAAGPGTQTFSFADGDTGHNLTNLDGVALFVGYRDAGDPNVYRVLVQDGGDFAAADDPTPGDNTVTAPVSFNHGTSLVARTADLYLAVGGGTAAGEDTVTVSNNPSLVDTFDADDGEAFDLDATTIDVPALVGSTSVQVTPVTGGDELLWLMAALRVQKVDMEDPTCSLSGTEGPPAVATNVVQDTGSGLAEIFATKSENADTVVPPFTVGTIDPVTVESTKIDQSQPANIEVRVTDLDGNVVFCEYTLNDPPVAVDDAAVTQRNTAVNIDVLANDIDPDADLLDVTVSDPPNGTVAVETDGTVTYTPDTDFVGTDSFTYAAKDDVLTDTATVTVDVVDDTTDPECSLSIDPGPPAVITNQALDLGGPGAASGIASVVVVLSENADTVMPPFTPGTTDPVTLTSTRIDQSTPIEIEVDVTDAAGNVATCDYTFGNPPTADDDTAATDENTAVDVDVLDNDTDPDVVDSLDVEIATPPNDGTATVLGTGEIRYTPDPGFDGVDTLTYEVTDLDGLTDTAMVTVTVDDTIPDPPPGVGGPPDEEEPPLFECPDPGPPPFDDVDPADVHAEAIACLADLGIVQGDGDGTFDPSATVTRGQLATMLRNLLDALGAELGADHPDAFADDDGNVHEDNINALAAAGIVQGDDNGAFRPNDGVTRGQLTSLIRAALGFLGVELPDGPDAFADDDGDVHEDNINALAGAGIVQGTGPGTFDPGGTLTRGQAATALVQAAEAAAGETPTPSGGAGG